MDNKFRYLILVNFVNIKICNVQMLFKFISIKTAYPLLPLDLLHAEHAQSKNCKI